VTPDEAITVIIPTSPIAVNPSTEIIDETVAQMRKHLPDARLSILADGVHPEEDYLKNRYEKYLTNLRMRAFEWGTSRVGFGNWPDYEKRFVKLEWHGLYVFQFDDWMHQSGMLRKILDTIETPLIYWCEHDLPLRDEPIDWQGIVDTLLEGKIGGIRFELTGDPPKRNEVRGTIVTHGIPLTLSTQYVNWPQVFRLDYLKAFLEPFGNSKTYLECPEFDGRVGQLWSKWQYGIYSPAGEIRRCYHTHGRAAGGFGDPGKPYIIVNGKQRNVYATPYKPLF
jgi:hypothetical protein